MNGRVGRDYELPVNGNSERGEMRVGAFTPGKKGRMVVEPTKINGHRSGDCSASKATLQNVSTKTSSEQSGVRKTCRWDEDVRCWGRVKGVSFIVSRRGAHIYPTQR